MSDGMSDSSCYGSEEMTFSELGSLKLKQPLTVLVLAYKDGFEVRHPRLGIRVDVWNKQGIPLALRSTLEQLRPSLESEKAQVEKKLRILDEYLP